LAPIYFPEPAEADRSRPRWGEKPLDYYARSAKPEARAVREFLNRTLVYFPDKDAKSLAKKLRQDWQSFFFEIIVGRYLQVLGAGVEHDATGSNGTDVDYRATFPDGVVSVECVSKKYNMEARAEMLRHENMSNMLDEVGPHQWAINFRKLPAANSEHEFRPYVTKVADFYATLPEAVEEAPHHHFEWTGEHGRIVLEAMPFPKGTMPNHIGAGTAWFDNSVARLRDALIDSGKRRQARGAVQPVFLAIDCPFIGPDAEDFDQALFGTTVDHRGFDPDESVGVSFDPNGLFVSDRDIPFAGVIAFLGMRMTTAGDPVIYLNPYQRWKLPAALASHEQRVWTSRIDRTPAVRRPVIQAVGFVEYPADDD
jgi:hypothetical protein